MTYLMAMRTSPAGLELIKQSEGLRLKPYIDVAGHSTVGYGHLITLTEKSHGLFNYDISEATATEILKHDLMLAELAVSSLVHVQLTQGQFDALVDFVFNLGSGALAHSTLLAKLNAGDYAAARAEFAKWCYTRDPSSGKYVIQPGLQKRRQREMVVWDT